MNEGRKELFSPATEIDRGNRPAVTQHLVDEASAGQRLDNFLLRLCRGVPKSHIYRIVRSGEVRINGRRADVTQRLEIGDRVRLPPLSMASAPVLQKKSHPAAGRSVQFEVLHEDDGLLALNKPPGLPVHAGSGVLFGLIEALRGQRPDSRFLELAHRLDRETSGVLLVGKKRSALKALHDMFRQGTADKRYLVLVHGEWPDAYRDVRMPLERFLKDDGERRVRVNADEGRFARTVFRRLAVGLGYSLLEAQLFTGRTHQIRVHLAAQGTPILGDDKYGDFALNRHLTKEGLKRMFLHAWRIRFPHPVSAEMLQLEAPLPADLASFLRRVGMEVARHG